MNHKMKTYTTILFITILVCIFSGCASIREQMLGAGFDENYVDGYEQGHSSGFHAAGHPYYRFWKDTHRYEVDSQYRQGWDDGFSVAKGQYDSIRQSMR